VALVGGLIDLSTPTDASPITRSDHQREEQLVTAGILGWLVAEVPGRDLGQPVKSMLAVRVMLPPSASLFSEGAVTPSPLHAVVTSPA
jgi:hypothetical protein